MIFQEELLIVISPEAGRGGVVIPGWYPQVWHGLRLREWLLCPGLARVRELSPEREGEYKTISPPWPDYSLTPILDTNWTGNSVNIRNSNYYAIHYHGQTALIKPQWLMGPDKLITWQGGVTLGWILCCQIHFLLWEFPWVYLVYMTQWQFAFLGNKYAPNNVMSRDFFI